MNEQVDKAAYEQEVIEAGIAGLHTVDCWGDDPERERNEHSECRAIVTAVVDMIVDAGYTFTPKPDEDFQP